MTSPHLCLASASPRRRELLTQIGIAHSCLPQDIDEAVLPDEAPHAYVRRLALAKASSALNDARLPPGLPVLAADTTVVIQGQILGKPTSAAQASVMLQALSGATHEVLTGIAVGSGQLLDHVVVSTLVSFRELTRQEIAAYWESGAAQDKAGAYGIQGAAAIFVSRIEGSYTNVVGLPLYETMQLLSRHGINTTSVLRGVLS